LKSGPSFSIKAFWDTIVVIVLTLYDILELTDVGTADVALSKR
jgi:hypothetical protein